MDANIYQLGYEDSDLTSFDSEDSSVNSHFKFHNKPKLFTGTKTFKIDRQYSVKFLGFPKTTFVVIQQEFEDQNIKLLFKNSCAKSIKLDVRNTFLLEIQSNMDLIFNPKLVGKLYKDEKKIRLFSNEGEIFITNKA